MGVRKLKQKPAKEAGVVSCYLCGEPADDNLVGLIRDRLCDYDCAVETGEEHWQDMYICTKCFVKTHGAVFTLRALKTT